MTPIALLLSALGLLLAPTDPATAQATAAATAAATAQATDPEMVSRIVQMGFHDSRVMEHLDVLVNGFGPRLTGSTNLEQAEAWAVVQFRSYGLDARLEPWGEAAVGFDRGPQKGAVVAPEPQELTFLTYAWTPGTGGPRRARAVLGPADAAGFDAQRAGLAGAWVLLSLEARSDAALRKAFDDAAAELQFAGVITPSRDDTLLVMSGQMPETADDLGKFTRISLLAPQFRALEERLKAGEAVELEFDIDNRVVPGPIPLDNVVADLRGSELPDEYVIVGGHLDSWDGATGTTDNGTGCATTLEAARLLALAGAQPRRTIRFMLWSGEEQGLLGSAAWVAAHPDVLPHISAVLVHDGGTAYISGLGVTPAMRPQIEAAFAPVLRLAEDGGDDLPFAITEVGGLSPFGASDHSSFVAGGAPGFFWEQAGGIDYDHTHHTQFDTFDAANEPFQKHSAVVAALGALGIADLPGLLDRDKLVAPQTGRRRLGIMPSGDGATVGSVAPGGLAEKHGLLAGDTIVSINGEAVATTSLQSLLRKGEGRKVVVWKRGEQTLQDVFEWDLPQDGAREPEAVTLLTDDGVTLQADYFMGAPDGPAGSAAGSSAGGSAIVLLHMYGSDRAAWGPVREPLSRAGIATLAIDLRGHGQSLDAGGALAARAAARDPALFDAMARDAAAGVAWLESRAYPAARIGLVGASVGCSVAIRAAVADARLAGVAALSPGRDYLGLDSLADLSRWDLRPILLVNGTDEEADSGNCASLRDAALAAHAWAPVQVVIVPGAEIHGTRMFGAAPGIEQQLTDWWVARLR